MGGKLEANDKQDHSKAADARPALINEDRKSVV